LTWDSGSIEEWDLPLFELEQTGTGKFSDGRPYTVQASLQTPLNSL